MVISHDSILHQLGSLNTLLYSSGDSFEYRNPTPTVDVIVYRRDSERSILEVLLIERVNPPYGWALPGGFVDEWEMAETAFSSER